MHFKVLYLQLCSVVLDGVDGGHVGVDGRVVDIILQQPAVALVRLEAVQRVLQVTG